MFTRVVILGLLLCAPVSQGAVLLSTNSTWRFFRGTNEASLPDTTSWRSNTFNDASFTDMAAPFWYGDVRPGGSQLTDMQGTYSCFFLRKTFTVNNAAQIGGLKLTYFIDDGFVAWINGKELYRENVVDPINTNTLASNQPIDPAPLTNQMVLFDNLQEGPNIIAVQVFNTSLAGSSDIGFDFQLETFTSETNPPTIFSVSPTPGEVTSLTSINVTFSEAVVGVDAADLLISGVPATSLSASSPSNYTFYSSQPSYGLVQIAWDANHNIKDNAFPPNAFNANGAGATWQYQLVDRIPPMVTTTFPAAGSTVRMLSQIEVTFSEDVNGVNASDLLINGVAATNVVSQPGAKYQFQFSQPATGVVQVTWSSAHGITDLASTPNAFVSNAWQYVLDPNANLASLVLNEILVSNESTNGLRDDDDLLRGVTNQVDWLEIYNAGATAVDLGGWSLSDDPDEPGLWVFPAKLLQPGHYLIVMTSGKDIKNPVGNNHFHTNFRLSRAGDFLGLYSPDSPRVLISGFTPEYPEQRNDISYGYDTNGNLRYFATPTPEGPNGVSTIVDVVEPVHFSVTRGFYSNAFTLNLSTPTPNAQIRYTVDGGEPTLTIGSPYVQPLRITNTALIRAAAFKTNFLSSRIITHSYLFHLNASQRSLPVLSIVTATNNLIGRTGVIGMSPDGTRTEGTDFYSLAHPPTDFHNPSQHGIAWERPVSAEFIRPEDNSGFQIDCGIRVQGSDWQRPRTISTSKFSFRLYFRGAYGPGRLDYPLFPLTTLDSFDQIVLRAGYNEKVNPFIRDEITRRLSSDMGEVAPHGNVVLLLLNGGYHTNDPGGSGILPIYNTCERVHEEMLQSHLGGGSDWDVVGPDFAVSSEGLGIIDGDRRDFGNLLTNVWNGNTVRRITNAADYIRISKRLDLVNFVDYCLLNGYVAMGDWPANNWRAGRDRGNTNALWRFIPWDAEWAMGIYALSTNRDSFSYVGTGTEDAGLGSVGNSEIARLHQGLVANPEFRLLWADRIQKQMFNGGALSGANITNRFNQLRSELLGFIPNMETEILDWARDRFSIFMTQVQSNGLYGFSNATYGIFAYSNAPVFNQHGGRVPRNFALTMAAPLGGQIYYTTNGDDPRVPFSGAVSNSALSYVDPVNIAQSTRVKARTLLNGTNWSALADASFDVATLGVPLRITEIHYNPVGGRAFEFIELQNLGVTALTLGGFTISGDIDFTFAQGTLLASGGRFVLANSTDPSGFATHYGIVANGYFNGNLDNSGGRITLRDAAGQIIETVDFDNDAPWPTAADGKGSSLEIVNAYGDPDDPVNWRASSQIDGTPGSANSPAPAPAVLLNELMAENLTAVSNGLTHPDWIELYNAGSTINLGGWSLTDDGNPRKFVFPANTMLNAGSYLVVWCDAATNTTLGFHTDFALDPDGESVFLYNNSTSLVDAVSFGLQIADFSIGRIPSGNAAGTWQLTLSTTNSANIAATLGSATNLAINEWLANPVAGQEDWIEFFNRSAQPIGLRGLSIGTTSAVQQITSLSFIAPQGFAQLFADEKIGAGHLDLKLPSAGGSIILYDDSAVELTRVNYSLQTEGVSQGRLPDGTNNIVSFPGTASPKASNYQINYTGPYLNEVLARNRSATTNSAGQVADWVEFYNPNTTNFDMGGMSVSLDASEPGQWTFPPNAVIGAKGYLMLWCDGTQPASLTLEPNLNTGVSLNGDSGAVYLFNSAGQVVNFIEYGFQLDNQSIGRVGAQWRLLTSPTPNATNSAAATLGAATNLVVNEWMARPSTGRDWFEIYNNATSPVDMGGLFLTDDLTVPGSAKFKVAPLSFIAARGWVKWEADEDPTQGRNHVNFDLDGDGEALRIYNSTGAVIDTVYFTAQALAVSQGRLPDGAATIVNFAGSASPGESNYLPLENAFINEIVTHTAAPLEQAIELYNPTAKAASIGGWYLSDSRANYKKYRVPDGTTIPGPGYVVIYQNQFGSSFSFDAALGGELILSAADAGGNLTGGRSAVKFGAAANGVSFGRFPTSVGIDFVSMAQRTFGADNPSSVTEFRTGTGAANSYAKVGPVVISELMYHPLPWSNAVANADGEYIELHNIGGIPVPLYDPSSPSNRWRLANGVDFSFPTNATIPPGGFLLVVNFDPTNNPSALTQFTNQYGLASSAQIFGPYRGKLDNGGEQVELYMPDTSSGSPVEPLVLADLVNYSDAMPWPSGAVDGGGLSLQRRNVSQYGNEPLNWIASAPTPRATNGNGIVAPPVVTMSPVNQTVAEDSAISLHVSATGTAPLGYQWRRNGISLPGATNALLMISYAQLDDEGAYDVFVSNAGGSARSAAARVTVPVPPVILIAPQSQTVTLSNSVTFSVAARGSSPLSYQWIFNGTNRGSDSTFSLPNVQIEDDGEYTLVVSNAFGSLTLPITLSVLARPIFTEHPQSLVVAAGATVSFRIGVRASPSPVTFRWRRNGATVGVSNSIVSGPTASPFASIYFTNAVSNAFYAAVVSNIVGTAFGGPGASGLSSNAYLTVIVPPTNQTAAPGATATFSALQRGNYPVRYQWQFNNANITDATNATLVLSNLVFSQAGNYGVTVIMITNQTLGGAATFAATGAFTAALQVAVPPPRLSSPQYSAGAFQMLLEVMSNQTYAVEASPFLSNWTTLRTFTATNNVQPFSETTNAVQRFYRARAIQPP